MVYIDLNMVRAGTVQHPSDWTHCGYNEIQRPPARFRKINIDALAGLLGFSDLEGMRTSYRSWIDTALHKGKLEREPCWTESVAVGEVNFLKSVQKELDISNPGRRLYTNDSHCVLREEWVAYQAYL